jgi:hypothetical protein
MITKPKGECRPHAPPCNKAASAYLRWLEIVARDEVTASWLYIERVASALAERDTLTAAEIAEILSRNDEAPPAVSESS